MSISKCPSVDRCMTKRAIDQNLMKPYSAKITRALSKDSLLKEQVKAGKTLKISRRSGFSHIVPKKREGTKVKGAWLLWVVIFLLLTAAVLLPPKIKLMAFQRSHSLHHKSGLNELGGDRENKLVGKASLATVRKLYPKQTEWLVLGLDTHICVVLEALQADNQLAVGIAPKTVSCNPLVGELVTLRPNLGYKPAGVESGGVGADRASSERDQQESNTQNDGNTNHSLSEKPPADGVMGNTEVNSSSSSSSDPAGMIIPSTPSSSSSSSVGSESSSGLTSTLASSSSSVPGGGVVRWIHDSVHEVVVIVGSDVTQLVEPGRRPGKSVEILVREATRLTRKDIVVLEPDGVHKEKRQQWGELYARGCKRDRESMLKGKEIRKGVPGFTLKLFACSSAGSSSSAPPGVTANRPPGGRRPLFLV